MNSDKKKSGSDDLLDVGAEEFSEKIYDEKAPTPAEFKEPHSISMTGAELHEAQKQQSDIA